MLNPSRLFDIDKLIIKDMVNYAIIKISLIIINKIS